MVLPTSIPSVVNLSECINKGCEISPRVFMTSTRYKYTLGFIYCPKTSQVLFLNRQKLPWMGRWNGVGGKLDAGESPLECIIRETKEETGLDVPLYKDKGVLRWVKDDIDLGGVHLFVGEVSPDFVAAYKTPRCFCHEGVLDWKKVDWLLHKDNTGIVDNIKIILESLLTLDERNVWIAEYKEGVLFRCESLLSLIHI